MTKLIKIPFSKGNLGKNEGCELAPAKIIEQLEEVYSNESGFKPQFQIDEVKVDQNNIEDTNKKIFEKIKGTSARSIVLGGDHSITYASFKGFAANNKGAGLVVFDAHPDCTSEMSPPTHEDYIRALVNEKVVSPDKIILIAVRDPDPAENEFLELKKIKVFSMKRLTMMGIEEVADTVTETIKEWPSFYLSIDIDAADPAFAPGTGYIEPGGLTSRELIYFVQRIKLLKNWQFADIVEVNPRKDVNGMTSKLAAKLVFELS